MNADKIRQFYSATAEYFEKKQEIMQAMEELELLRNEVNMKLKDTVDNDFSTQRLVKVSNAYDKFKFNSNIVQEFVKDVVDFLFKGLDRSNLDRLELTSMKIDIIYDGYGFNRQSARVNGPFSLRFTDLKSDRSFNVLVPVKDSTCTDIIHWEDNGDGMYIIYAMVNGYAREICRVFDVSKVPNAVRKYLDGDFDEDIKTIYIDCLIGGKNNSIDYELFEINSEEKLKRFSRLMDGHDFYRHSSEMQIEHCIDDRNEYLEKTNSV